MSEININKYASKVFFLFIPHEYEEKIVKKIALHEFEVYAFFEDAERYLPSLEKIYGAIIFAYIRRGKDNVFWNEGYERLASNASDCNQKISTWIGDAGYLTLDSEKSNFIPPVSLIDIAERSAGVVDYIVSFLTECNARGNRRHIRVPCGENSQSSFSIKRFERNHSGKVLDISSFGMACTFNTDLELKIHVFIEDIQLRFSGQSYIISGSITAKRVIDNKTVYIIVFDFMDNEEARKAVTDYVYRMLQRNFRDMYG